MPGIKTLRAMSSALKNREISSTELTQEHLAKIAADKTNSFVTVAKDNALEQAKQAQQRREQGSSHPLTGVPLAHKDIFCTQGITTTCGSRMLENFVAPYDAHVVALLNQAGMVTLGKTNMDEFAMGSSNESSHFGPVSNPWNLDKVPGGSSGGSAAAVAAGLVACATGTDTGGSIRQPAALCGITGLKPTYGRISRYGMIAFASSLDQAGPMTCDAEDAALMLSAMAGFDSKDSTSAQRQDAWLADFAEQGIPDLDRPLKIGLPQEYYTDLSNGSIIEAGQNTLAQQGHELVDVSLPHTQAAIPVYYVIAGAEASTNLSRYDGVRFGHRCENPQSLEDLYKRSRSEGFGDEVKRRILTGTYTLSVGYFDAYYIKAQQIRRLISEDFSNVFADIDVLLTPTSPTPAFSKGQLSDDPIAMYQQDLYTVPTSLAGLPALSMPCGFVDGLPVGAQLIAPAFREDVLLGLAAQYQKHSDWHLQRPNGSRVSKEWAT
ncbi:MAG: Asp-tRNA(Asn)/Glu-tRNA(Gln) amidotransferase GatCAB subunit A [Gammaproteobacteria bacterium]|nr:Asp-tRNA(Asn)/Glu-tRNA(Gln) amidotransferase GatCAB subunit A [Gammaproteobacteria bacterium]